MVPRHVDCIQIWLEDFYYQNTYDFKGEEEDVQPSGVDVEEHYEINGHVNGEAIIKW